MKEYAKLKPLMLIPLLKLVVCFLITNKIMSTVKLFTDDISLFFVVIDAKIFADKLNKDLKNISECVYK